MELNEVENCKRILNECYKPPSKYRRVRYDKTCDLIVPIDPITYISDHIYIDDHNFRSGTGYNLNINGLDHRVIGLWKYEPYMRSYRGLGLYTNRFHTFYLVYKIEDCEFENFRYKIHPDKVLLKYEGGLDIEQEVFDMAKKHAYKNQITLKFHIIGCFYEKIQTIKGKP